MKKKGSPQGKSLIVSEMKDIIFIGNTKKIHAIKDHYTDIQY